MGTSTDDAAASTDRVYHLTTRAEWEQAQASGVYSRSTRGRSLEDVGFIHCSTPAQLGAVAELFYADCEDELIVLALSLSALDESGLPVRFEDGGDGTFYPHIYAPLPSARVQETLPAAFDEQGRFVLG